MGEKAVLCPCALEGINLLVLSGSACYNCVLCQTSLSLCLHSNEHSSLSSDYKAMRLKKNNKSHGPSGKVLEATEMSLGLPQCLVPFDCLILPVFVYLLKWIFTENLMLMWALSIMHNACCSCNWLLILEAISLGRYWHPALSGEISVTRKTDTDIQKSKGMWGYYT